MTSLPCCQALAEVRSFIGNDDCYRITTPKVSVTISPVSTLSKKKGKEKAFFFSKEAK